MVRVKYRRILRINKPPTASRLRDWQGGQCGFYIARKTIEERSAAVKPREKVFVMQNARMPK
jgi:hypothetical protein